MRQLRVWAKRLAAIAGWKHREADLSAEIESHLQMHIDDNVRAGMNAQEARRMAILRLGGIERTKELYRDRRGFPMLETLLKDLRYALRMLRKSPGFTSAALLTLGLGIGANTALFSVVRGVLLESAPFRDPANLVIVVDSNPSQSVDWAYVSQERFDELARASAVFEQTAAAHGGFVRLEDGSAPRMVESESVSAGFFPLLGVKPILGRLFTADEDRPGTDQVALLSYSLWRNQYGADPAIVGRKIGRSRESQGRVVIGVLPPHFQFVRPELELWVPLALNPASPYRALHELLVVARLKRGVTIGQARSALSGVAAQLAQKFPTTGAGWGLAVRDFQQFYTGRDNVRRTLLVLLASVGVLLLIACSNIANLLLTRAMVRRREIALRLALGASRARVAGQLFLESLLLGLAGGAAGFALARVTFHSLVRMAPNIATFRSDALRIDPQVFLFAIVVAVFASVLFGLVPALRGSRVDLNESLREAGRGTRSSPGDRRTRNWLVASEIALATVLLAGAGLLLESFHNLETDWLGFNPNRVLTMWTCCLDPVRYSGQREISNFYEQVFQRLRVLPGVESASASTRLPLRQVNGIAVQFEIRGQEQEPAHRPAADLFWTDSDYFHTMQIPLLRGRFFDNHDGATVEPVALINESLARSFWPGQDPIGQGIRPYSGDSSDRWHRIIGVVADAKQRGRGMDARPTYYLNFAQEPVRYSFFVIRTRTEPFSVANAVKKEIWSVDSTLPLENVLSLEQAMDASLSTQRFSTLLLSLFAGLALCLGALGVYGVTSYGVAQRIQEIGVRMSLGASPAAILGMILRESMTLAVAGLGVGTAAALASTRFLQSLLYGTKASNPTILAGAIAFLLLVTLFACFVPARRAMRVDPMVALRSE